MKTKNAAILAVGLWAAALVWGQTSGPLLTLTAIAQNVTGAPDAIRIDLLRWSTDAERDQLMAAWNMTAPAPGRGGRGGAGRAGAARGGRGAGGRAGAAPDGAAGDADAAPAGRRGAAVEAPPATPEGSLAAALQKAPTVGYLWSSEVAGYALRYAGRVTAADGSERILLITDRRLGNTNDRWAAPGSAAGSPYDFSVIELRLNPKGEGEGKISLAGKVTPDSAAKIVALENYDTLPVVLKNVKRRAPAGK